MAYIVPSILVYQQLQNAGGVLNSTPDLDTCIIGPAYNIMTYDGTVANQVLTAALSTTTTTGSMALGAFTVTGVVNPGLFSVAQRVIVIGAGAGGSNLVGKITVITGNVLTLDTAALTAVTTAVVSGFGQIANSAVPNTFALPGQKPGQTVTLSTVTPWLNTAVTQTAVTGSYGNSNNSLVTIQIPTGITGSITGGLTTLTITNATMATFWAVGDVVSVANAGAGGTTPLVATITVIAGTSFTLSIAAITTATTQAISKVLVSNLNSTTNTLRAEVGDTIKLIYTDQQSVAGQVFYSNILSENTSSGLNGNWVSFGLNDVLPDNFSTPTTTGTVGAASTAMVVALGTNFTTGDTVQITGSGAAGVTQETTVTVSGVTFTLGAAATTAVTNAKVVKVLRTTAAVTSGTTVLTTITGSGSSVFAVTDRIIVVGAGANGSDHISAISAVGATSVTLVTPTITTTSGATVLKKVNNFQLQVLKTYNNQQMASTKPISGGANFDTSTTAATGQVTINANSELVYGKVVTADVYFAYNALRTDLAGTVNEFTSINDVEGILGFNLTDSNPLGLGLQIALANTTGRIFGIGIATDDLTGHQTAMTLLENQRMYCLVPLTQNQSILASYKTHVDQMSTPANASWRVVLANTAIPTTIAVGQYSSTFVNSNGGNNTVVFGSGVYTLTASNATFVSDGVVPGDVVTITASTPSTDVGTHVVSQVVSNQQLIIVASAAATAVSYYVTRNMTKAQQASSVAAVSAQFNDNRVVHVQPDTAGVLVNGVVKYLPGYYLCAGVGGMTSGFPVQQGFTNIGIAGISDLKNSNYYFGKADLNTMAASGTFIFVQATQGGIPYVRHELTTNISVLQYREFLVVKNWDFLSYYYRDKLTPFVGTWNITKETLNTLRQTIVASSELLLTQKLPKIGAPLLSYNIQLLEQDKFNQDTVNCNLLITVVYPLNYMNLYLII